MKDQIMPDKLMREESTQFMPRFDANGLISCITVDNISGEVLMLAHMNAKALNKTLETGQVWYWSRSRQELWLKGATSGQIQILNSLWIDCDQDALLLKVTVDGDGGCCHTGRHTCFYRQVKKDDIGNIVLKFK
jgi:phosphoribosyl-AMP cyclohydrolase